MLFNLTPYLTDWTWITTGLICLITFYLVWRFQEIRSLPPGPIPLPVLGNLLELRGKGVGLSSVFHKYKKKYNDIFTLWLGMRPTIMVCNWDLCHEALISKRNDFSGRIRRMTVDLFLHGHDDVVFSDFGPKWETLRKVLTTAVRKYAVSENLAELVIEVVDNITEEMIKDNHSVEATNYTYLMIYNILASSTCGQRFESDDPEFLYLRTNNDLLGEKLGVGSPADVVPILKFFYRKQLEELQGLADCVPSYMARKLKEHKATYQSGNIRDFTDALLAAKEEAELEEKGSLQYLTEDNLVMVLADLFGAGTDTTRALMLWMILYICDEPKLQRRMQAEIDEQIGSRFPTQSDRALCPYVQAVMTETLRLQPSIDFSLEHKTTCDTELGGYKIPKDTSCVFYIKGPQYEPDHWPEPSKFKPERFLNSDGKFLNTRIQGYMPFGLGRRSCPGEKLALADTFLIITRLLQNYSLELRNGPGSGDFTSDPRAFTKTPPKYEIIIKHRKNNH